MAIHVRIVSAAVLVFILLVVSNAAAAQVQLVWDPPTDASDAPMIVAGYRLYYGIYDIEGMIDVGDQSVYMMSGLEPGKTYFLAVTAYDISGDESEFSNVLWITLPDTPANMTEANQADTGQGSSSGIHSTFDTAGEVRNKPSQRQPALVNSVSQSASPRQTDFASSITFADLDGGGLARGREEIPHRAARHSAQTGAGLSYSHDPDGASSTTWTNYRLNLTLGSEHDDDIGVIFRYQDWNNYYRFLWNHQDGYRRVEKQENGVFILLAEDTSLSAPMQSYELTVVIADEALEIWINDALIFSVTDDSFLSGSIALYTFGKGDNYFDNILVEDLDTDSVLLWDDFNNGMFTDWMIVDEGVMRGLAKWSAEHGVLVQRADFDAESADGSDLTQHGTFALYMP
jgi:hypothetical protein